MVVEVHNTHGERHQYTLRPDHDGRAFVASMDKAFYVSPFIAAAGGTRSASGMRHRACGSRSTSRRRGRSSSTRASTWPADRLTDRTVARMLVRYPLGPHRTIGMIHWHALQLWRRGLRILPSPGRRPMSRRRTTLRAARSATRSLSRLAGRIIMAAAANIRVGHLTVVLPDRSRQTFGDRTSGMGAEIRIHDRKAFVRLLLGGEIGAGEAYMDDLWSSAQTSHRSFAWRH